MNKLAIASLTAALGLCLATGPLLATLASARQAARQTASRYQASGYVFSEGTSGTLGGASNATSEQTNAYSNASTNLARLTLFRGNRYVLVVGGDENLRSLGMSLYDEGGQALVGGKQGLSGSTGQVLEITPRYSGSYYVQVNGEAAQNGGSYVLLVGRH